MSKTTDLIRRLFAGLWRGVRVFCTTFWVVVTLVLTFSLMALLMGEDLPDVPDQGALVVTIDGTLVDEMAEPQLLDMLSGGGGQVLLRDWIAAVTAAATDDRITTLFLALDSFAGARQSKLAEFGDALQTFKDSGKTVIAWATGYNQSQYYLASYADEIYMHPQGEFLLNGMVRSRTFYKGALDKFNIDFQIFKVGSHKDAVEPYMHRKMSDASREHSQLLLNRQWLAYTSQVEQNRQLPEGTIQQLVENGRQKLVEYRGDNFALVSDAGLIDGGKDSYQMKAYLEERLGTDQQSGDYLQIAIADYSKHCNKNAADTVADRVAVVVAAGEIVDGEAGPGKVGGDTLVKQLEAIREDDSVKALVLRVDSPGGSAFASGLIRDALLRIKAKGIPVVVSMGSLAASGGYWISADADEIWATPTTITGSIGVLGMLPNIERVLGELGVTSDRVGTSGAFSEPGIMSSLDPDTTAAIQAGIEYTYRQFLTLVAQGRDRTVAEIDQIGQGRVWSGSHALDIGLVDKLGSLNDAIASAAERADLQDYSVSYFEKERGQLGKLLQSVGAKAIGEGWLDQQSSRLLANLLAPVSQVTGLNDPKGLYLYCDDCAMQ